MSVKVNKNQNQRIRPPWPIAKSMPCRKQQKDAEEKFANNQLNDDCSLGEALSSPTKWIASLMPATLSALGDCTFDAITSVCNGFAVHLPTHTFWSQCLHCLKFTCQTERVRKAMGITSSPHSLQSNFIFQHQHLPAAQGTSTDLVTPSPACTADVPPNSTTFSKAAKTCWLEKGTRPLAVMSEKVSEECRKQQSELYKTVTISLKCSEATLKTAQV
ncbi:hypothetical protein Anapl_00772 [Anas platyrhynchos]|uniref:Uncharacterized protein n=1 Tax=Anas platyrhynchos TaxID=8839 RepID=R0JSR0_ANAPL|nr:hypothetical protein Anapl_00772 [Anas platyrhynchos]